MGEPSVSMLYVLAAFLALYFAAMGLFRLADWLKKYVGLQQVWFNNAFSFELHMDERGKNLKIY